MTEPEVLPKRRRRWWIGVLVLFFVLGVGMATFKAVHHSEFAFLNDYGPTRVIEPGKMTVAAVPPTPDYRYEVYYYDARTSPRVLAAMRRELTVEKGYVVQDYGSGMISFTRGAIPNQYGAIYTTQNFYTMLWKDLPDLDPKGCIVLIAVEHSWWEAKWKAFRKFLHME